MITASLAIAGSGLVGLLITLLLGGLLAAVVFYVLSLFTPAPIPAIASLIVFLIVLLYALA